jgi:hypothetical protein
LIVDETLVGSEMNKTNAECLQSGGNRRLDSVRQVNMSLAASWKISADRFLPKTIHFIVSLVILIIIRYKDPNI